MKTAPTQKTFKPVTLILETQEEVDAIYALLNHTTASQALGLSEIDPDEVFYPSLWTTKGTDQLHAKLDSIIK